MMKYRRTINGCFRAIWSMGIDKERSHLNAIFPLKCVRRVYQTQLRSDSITAARGEANGKGRIYKERQLLN